MRLWDVATGQSKQTLNGHTHRVKCVVCTPDGKTLASCSSDGRSGCGMWPPATGEVRAHGAHGDLETVALSPDGKLLASSSGDTHGADLGHATSGKPLPHARRAHRRSRRGDVFAGRQDVASGCKDQSVKLWDPQTGELIEHDRRTRSAPRIAGLSPDGKILAGGSGGPESLVWLWRWSGRWNKEVWILHRRGHRGTQRKAPFFTSAALCVLCGKSILLAE